jgi:hypothetical protein
MVLTRTFRPVLMEGGGTALDLTTVKRFGDLIHPPRLGHEENAAWHGFLANVARGEYDLGYRDDGAAPTLRVRGRSCRASGHRQKAD